MLLSETVCCYQRQCAAISDSDSALFPFGYNRGYSIADDIIHKGHWTCFDSRHGKGLDDEKGHSSFKAITLHGICSFFHTQLRMRYQSLSPTAAVVSAPVVKSPQPFPIETYFSLSLSHTHNTHPNSTPSPHSRSRTQQASKPS